MPHHLNAFRNSEVGRGHSTHFIDGQTEVPQLGPMSPDPAILQAGVDESEAKWARGGSRNL